jgi:hypothetical protein
MTYPESGEPSSTSKTMPDVPSSIQSAGGEAVKHYRRMIAQGQSARFAEMCALQCPPGVRGTDRAVMQGRYNMEWLKDLSPDNAKRVLAAAKAAGINTSGKYYQSGLADRRGPADPAAWIDSAADIKKVARERNLHVSGIVDHVAEDVPPPPPKPLSERLIRRALREYRKQHPGKKEGELREMIIDKHAPRHKRGKK